MAALTRPAIFAPAGRRNDGDLLALLLRQRSPAALVVNLGRFVAIEEIARKTDRNLNRKSGINRIPLGK